MRIPEKVIEKVVGTAVPKPEADQDTDAITPARYLKEITFGNMGNYVYIDERYEGGKLIESHTFNDPAYQGAKIVVAGSNYGCGSSREHAPQALHRFGIDAVIAESFAEIFAGNCASLGVVGVTVSGATVAKLADYIRQKPSTELTIDLVNKVINYDGNTVKFDMPEARRKSFLTGTWDAMAVLQQDKSGIRKVESRLGYLSFK